MCLGMIKISVVVTSYRMGGLDLLVHSFAQQTLPVAEWELILVDGYWVERKHLLTNLPFNVKHIKEHKQIPIYSNSTGFNSGLLLAEGELVTFLIDYCWIYPGYLEAHWNWYQKYKTHSMSGYMDRYTPPRLADDSKNFNYNRMWAVFKDEFTADYADIFFANTPHEYCERKGGQRGLELAPGVYEMPGQLVYMIGDSIPYSVIKELNGWDELYNGGYGCNDIDIGVRANMLGWKFGLNPASIIQKLGTPTSSQVLPGINKLRSRTPEENYQRFTDRIAAIRTGRETVSVPVGRGAWR